MKRSIILLFAVLLAGCEETFPDRPVDMQFRVAVKPLENTCGDAQLRTPAAEYTAVIDVMQRSDGTLTLRTGGSTYIPGRYVYEGIGLKKGRIDFTFTDDLSFPKTYAHVLKGIVTPDRVDVTVSVDDRRPDGSDCRRKAQLIGNARPLLDPAALDGAYKITVEDYGVACPGDPPREKLYESNDLLTVNHYRPDAATFDLGQLKWTTMPAEDGTMETAFDSLIGGYGWPMEITGTVKGVFRTDDVRFSMNWTVQGDTSGCSAEATVRSGAKLIPSAESIDGEYRTAFFAEDGCAKGVTSSEEPMRLMTQPDGTFLLSDPHLGTIAVTPSPDGTIDEDRGLPGLGWTLKISGSASPPLLNYTVEYKEETSAGIWCATSYSASAHQRYIFSK